jgi:SAM-dependent methyltransferase
LVVGDLTNLDPSWFPRTYDVVTLLDVLEHLDNPAQVLQQVKSLLAPGGILIATVPAMQSLWSDRDAFLGHRRRFSCWDFSTLVQSAGLSVQHRNYLFSFLFAPAYIHRKILSSFLNKKGSEVEADELKVIPGVNGLLRAAGAIDVQWSLRWPLPFGTSTYCVAQRPSG